jgi:hypothetical protein
VDVFLVRCVPFSFGTSFWSFRARSPGCWTSAGASRMGLGGWHRHFVRMTDMGFMVEEPEVGEVHQGSAVPPEEVKVPDSCGIPQ